VLKVPAAALRFRLPGEGRGAGGGAGGAGGGPRGGRLSANAGAGAPMMAGAVGTGAAEPGARPGAATSGAGGAGANGGGWRGRGAAAGMDTAAIARIRAAVQAGTMTRDEARAQFQKLRDAAGGGTGGAAGRGVGGMGAGGADQGAMAGGAGTRWGGAGSRAAGTGRSGERGAGGAASDASTYRPGVIYVLRGGKPEPVRVLTGLSDGTTVEVVSRDLQAGDLVITGQDLPVAGNAGLQPPPGLGGPQFRIRGGGGGGGGGRGR
jgi:hypothetical protein